VTPYAAAYADLVQLPDLGVTYATQARAYLADHGVTDPSPTTVAILAAHIHHNEASQPATPTTPRQHDQGETTPDTPAN
jgi:hypothetical protein